MCIQAVCNKGSSFVEGVKNHFHKYGKAYLVGAVILSSIAITAYARSNSLEDSIVMYGNGRKLQVLDEDMAESAFRVVDLTPRQIKFLLKMSTGKH